MRVLFLTSLAIALATQASAQSATDRFAPYRFLLGEWNVSSPGERPSFVQHFRWGTGEAYLRFGASVINDAGEAVPHFEGVLVWNGVRKDLDMLVVLDLENGGRAQEQGTLSAAADGTITREIVATYSEELRPPRSTAGGTTGGWTARFRQTFQRVSRDTVMTALLRETPGGWVATFPGSERLFMIRKH
jgi:hypothetical protein